MSVSNLSGNLKRRMKSASRLYAVQALFQMESTSQPIDRVLAEFEEYRMGPESGDQQLEEGDIEHFRRVVAGAVNNQARIDQMTDRALVAKWPISRIDPTLRAVFRAAGAEMIEGDTPPKVAIVEYVEVALAFFPDGKESSFVNAVLDHMAREAKPGSFV